LNNALRVAVYLRKQIDIAQYPRRFRLYRKSESLVQYNLNARARHTQLFFLSHIWVAHSASAYHRAPLASAEFILQHLRRVLLNLDILKAMIELIA
jgi:hypothetical protein